MSEIIKEKVYHNGEVKFRFSIEIKSAGHIQCRLVAKSIKSYLSAWYFSCDDAKEDKSARSGDVLSRHISSNFTDYPATVIAFREGLRCICYRMNLYVKDTSVVIHDYGTLPL